MIIFEPVIARGKFDRPIKTPGLRGPDPVAAGILSDPFPVNQQKRGVGRSGMEGIAARIVNADDTPVNVEGIVGVSKFVASEIDPFFPSGAHPE